MHTVDLTALRDRVAKRDLSGLLERTDTALPTLAGAVWAAGLLAIVMLTGADRGTWFAAAMYWVFWVLTPVGLRLADRPGSGPETIALGWLRVCCIPAAVFGSLALLIGPGFTAALLSVVWLGFTAAIATAGVFRFLSRTGLSRRAWGDLGLVSTLGGGLFYTLTMGSMNLAGLGDAALGLGAIALSSLCGSIPLVLDRRIGKPTAPPDGSSVRTNVHLGRRTEADLQDLLILAEGEPYCVAPGLVDRDLPEGFRWDEHTVEACNFDDSCDALLNWAGHKVAGIGIAPDLPRIVPGETFVLAIPFGPFSLTASARISGIINTEECYGFVFSTLPHHLWAGEESLIVINLDGQARVTATSIWAPITIGSKLCGPLTRFLHARYKRALLEGIADAEDAAIESNLNVVLDAFEQRAQDLVSDESPPAYSGTPSLS